MKKKKAAISAAKDAGTVVRSGQEPSATGRRITPAPPPLPPPPAPATTTEAWSQVVGRKARRIARQAAVSAAAVQPKPPADRPTSAVQKRPTVRRPPRPPKTAAVTITVAPGGPKSYADVMREAKEKVPLAEGGSRGGWCG
nr:PREDICTED: atherin-like [Megachile rotundata]